MLADNHEGLLQAAQLGMLEGVNLSDISNISGLSCDEELSSKACRKHLIKDILKPALTKSKDSDICVKIEKKLRNKDIHFKIRSIRIAYENNPSSSRHHVWKERNKATQARALKLIARGLQEGCASIQNAIEDEDLLFGQNHIVNGGFELRVVKDKAWDIYSGRKTPGWRVDQADIETCPAAMIEFQTARTNVLSEFSGKQFAELDGHCWNRQDSRVSVYQVLRTFPGQEYKLSFKASSRDQIGALQVKVQDHERGNRGIEIIDPVVYAFDSENESLKLDNKSLKDFELTFTASSFRTKVSFADIDERKGTYGVLLDEIESRSRSIRNIGMH